MTELQVTDLSKSIFEKDSKSFIEKFDILKEEISTISYENNKLLFELMTYIDEEYGILTLDELSELQKILFFILDNPTFSIDEKNEKTINTLILSLLLLTNSRERLFDFNTLEIQGLYLLPIAGLIGDNDLFKSILNQIIDIPGVKEEILGNKEYLYTLGTKFIQGMNLEGLNILHETFGSELLIYPYDMYAISILYGNMDVFNELTPLFNSASLEIDEEGLLDLVFTAILNKRKNKEIIDKVFETIPISNFLNNEIKNEINQKKVLDFYNKLKEDSKNNNFINILENLIIDKEL